MNIFIYKYKKRGEIMTREDLKKLTFGDLRDLTFHKKIMIRKDYEELTVTDLKNLVFYYHIPNYNKLKKSELIDILEEKKNDNIDDYYYQGLAVYTLKDIAKSKGINLKKGIKKTDIIKLLKDSNLR
jgi:hypothetical protein